MKLKGAELLLLLLLLSRKRAPAPPQFGPGEWEPPPGTDNLGTVPLPPNPLGHGN